MTWPPVDSTEAREQREAQAERDRLEAIPHEQRCHDGRLGEDHNGRPIPCPTCRPHLARTRDRMRTQLYGRPA